MPVYNQFIATSTRPKKNKPFNEATTAGGAKVPRVGVNKFDLEAQAAEHGWKPRPLDIDEINKMGSAELRFHEIWNKAELDRVFETEKNKRINAERLPVWQTRRMWAGQATPEEDAKARATGEEFVRRHRRFPRTLESAQAIAAYMRDHDLDGTKLESYNTAFSALVEEGKITLAPVLSADEYLDQNPQLRDTRIPPIAATNRAKAQATAEHFEATAKATAASGNTNVVDYPHEQRGVPPISDIEKTSLRALVRKMTAAELVQKCSDDPSFKKKLDSLGV